MRLPKILVLTIDDVVSGQAKQINDMMVNINQMNLEWASLLNKDKVFSPRIIELHKEIILAKMEKKIVDIYLKKLEDIEDSL